MAVTLDLLRFFPRKYVVISLCVAFNDDDSFDLLLERLLVVVIGKCCHKFKVLIA